MTGFAGRVWRSLSHRVRSNSVVVLVGGTTLGQAVQLLASPMITRLYTPDDFGVLAVYSSIISVLLVLTSLRYELALPIPEDEAEAINLLALSSVLLVATTVSTAVGIFLLGNDMVVALRAPALRPYLWLIPLSTFGAGAYQILNYWATRRKEFPAIARTKVAQSLSQVGTQWGLGHLGLGPLGLVIGQMLGYVGGVGTLYRTVPGGRHVFRHTTLRGIQDTASRYRRFPLFTTWSSLLNSASVQLPVVVLSAYFGSAVAGWFGLGMRVLQTPMFFVGQAVAQVFVSRSSEAHRQGNVPETTRKVFEQLVAVAGAPTLLLALVGPELFSLVFGENWRVSGVYSQWLAPWLFLVFITAPLTSLVFVLGRQSGELYFQASLLLGRLGSLLLGAYAGGERLALQSYSAISAVIWMVYLIWLLRISGNSVRLAARTVLQEMIIDGFLLAPVWFVQGGRFGDGAMVVALVYGFLAVGLRVFVKVVGGNK